MQQTLFTIPIELGGVPLFGVGILLALWAAVSLVLLVRLVRRQGWNADTLGYLPVLAIGAAALLFLPRMFPGGLPIRGYGVMMLLGAGSGLALAVHRGRQMGIGAEVIFSLAFWMFLCGIVGARLFHVVEYWETSYYWKTSDHLDSWHDTALAIVNVPQGGLVVYGALIGALVAFLLFAHRHALPALAVADLIAPSMALGLALGRIGCLLNGCCYGGECQQSWAVHFPPGSPPYMRDIFDRRLASDVMFADGFRDEVEVFAVAPNSNAEAAGLRVGQQVIQVGQQVIYSAADAYRALAAQAAAGEPLRMTVENGQEIVLSRLPIPPQSRPTHPTQIYSAVNALLLFWFLWQVYPFRRRDGEVIALLLTIYPVTRFLLEIIRTDEVPVFGTGLSISQNVSVVILVAVVSLWWYVWRQPRGSVLPASSQNF